MQPAFVDGMVSQLGFDPVQAGYVTLGNPPIDSRRRTDERASADHHRPGKLRVVLPAGGLLRELIRRGLDLAGDVSDSRDDRMLARFGAQPGVSEQLPGVLGGFGVDRRRLPGTVIDADFHGAQRRAVVEHESKDLMTDGVTGDADD